MWDSRWGEQVDRGTMSEEEFFRLRREERPELAKAHTSRHRYPRVHSAERAMASAAVQP